MQTPATLKGVIAISPLLVDNTTATAIAIDTMGFNYALIQFIFGAGANSVTVLKLQECETSGGSYADITGSAFTGADLPSATDDNQIWNWNVKLGNGRMRFIKVVATLADESTGTNVAAIANLGMAEESPWDATTQGASYLISL